jgi:hypothetical protein
MAFGKVKSSPQNPTLVPVFLSVHGAGGLVVSVTVAVSVTVSVAVSVTVSVAVSVSEVVVVLDVVVAVDDVVVVVAGSSPAQLAKESASGRSNKGRMFNIVYLKYNSLYYRLLAF